MVSIAYKELRNQSPKFAREIVRRVLKENWGNVSKVARILGISRHTVRRAREGELEDKSKRPKKIPRKTDAFLEKLIVKEGERTGYRYRRLTKYMSRK
ncbi:MAG TPA: helix-turn-helix domain-containing protein [Syntrophorhabdaceae bacterium]|nr:helix-turn-helix domain-containing protein [Syntrophorhabdaceae bacterium]HPP42669.1 helix-turn-helix domain-containing protein [Syntrophorhabdaceae bacterium]